VTHRAADRPRILPAEGPGAIDEAAAAIRAGDVVAIPTETVYGVACALDPVALGRVTAAKGRPEGRPISLLIDSVEQASALAEFPTAALRLADRFWPGPLTIVLALKDGVVLPAEVVGADPDGRPTAGFRLPDHPVPRALARELGPLPTTSANPSGEPEAPDARSIEAALGPNVSLILDGGEIRGGVSSSVVAVGLDGRLKILREAAIPRTALEDVLA
jgi:L-threonylcarbamoyladenylate synthase